MTYQYFVEDSDLAESEISEDAAEAMRVGERKGSSELPDGVE